MSFSYDDLKVESTASSSLKKQKGTFSELNFDYGIAIDKRDRVFAPTAGYTSKFNQSIPLYADARYIQNTYAFSQYKSLSPDAIGTFKFYTSAINGLSNKNVRVNKRLYVSSKRLRGFKSIGPKDGLDYVGGNYLMVSNFELSLPNFLPESTKTDVGLFLDFANLWKVDYDKTIDDANKIRSSAGMQASWLSPAGPVTFVLAQNILKASTDSTQFFTFNLGTTF